MPFSPVPVEIPPPWDRRVWVRKKITDTPPSNALTFGLRLGADTGAAFVLLAIFLDGTGSRH